MPFDDTRVHLLIAQESQHVFQAGFAIEGADFDLLDPTPFVLFIQAGAMVLPIYWGFSP